MKLSQAIRTGAEQTVRGTGMYFTGKYEGKIVACALGSAWIAEKGTGELEECNSYQLSQIWPELIQDHTSPNGELEGENLWRVITWLNDDQKWDNAKIATWLEQEGL